MDLDAEQCLILLREKCQTQRWQPVSPTLMTHLLHHGDERHAPRGGQLLRYRSGKPITARRYDHLWQRLGEHLSWVATQQISTHWLRHTHATHAIATGMPLDVLQQHLGHASLSTTTVYVTSESQRRMKAVKSFWASKRSTR